MHFVKKFLGVFKPVFHDNSIVSERSMDNLSIPNFLSLSTSTVENDNYLAAEIPESAIDPNAAVETWLPHSKGQQVICELWRTLPSNFRFFLNGRIMTGPGIPLWIYLNCILAAITVSYVAFDVLPFYETWPDGIIGGILVFLSFSAMYNLTKAVLSDPGYMLPHWFSSQNSWLTKDITLEEIYEKYGYTSYCTICKIFQFPDTFHCDECHACIDKGDHHCPLLGTCIGKRNYGNFYLFALSANVAFWLGLGMTITHLVMNWIAHGVLFALARAVPLYLIISTMIFPPLGTFVLVVLLFMHTKLIYQGVTLSQQEIFHTLFELHGLSKSEKLFRFFRNIYTRVIKAPPPSQIPNRVLQLKVRMPAIPRTELANEYHGRLQTENILPKAKLVMKTIFSENPLIFHRFRLQIIYLDMEQFGHLSTTTEDLKKAQKDIAKREKTGTSRPSQKLKPPKKSSARRSIFSLCLSSNSPVFPSFKGNELSKGAEDGNQIEMRSQEISKNINNNIV